jgi:hypothetical protein
MFDPNGKDAIYIDFVDVKVTSSCFPLPKVHHAGVMLINNKTGEAVFYHFGPYGTNGNGLVVKMNLGKIGIENGKLNEKDIGDKLKLITKKHGDNSNIEGAYIKSDKFDEMKKYAENKMKETSKSLEDTYNAFTNNCATFASDVIKQDKSIGPNGFSDMFYITPDDYLGYYQDNYSDVKYNAKEETIEISK